MLVEGFNNGQKIYKYKELDKEVLYDNFKKLSLLFGSYLSEQSLDKNKVCVDKRLVNEVFVRLDKRRDYFLIYHSTDLSEIRESALLAYWILKFKPFNIASELNSDFKVNINCGFALYIVLDSVNEYHKRKKNHNIKLSEDYVKKLNYAFKYWDLSKEAIMLIGETLCEHVMNIDEA